MRRTRASKPLVAVALALALALAAPLGARASAYPSDSLRPNLAVLLQGYRALWTPSGRGDLHGTVVARSVLQRDDRIAVWINRHATAEQRFQALQDSEYRSAVEPSYDQSLTVSTALGSVLGPLYVRGRLSGALPLTSALIDSTSGTSGAYLSTGGAKATYSHPRPYLPASAKAKALSGADSACAPSRANASSLTSSRVGKSWADADGDLRIRLVPDAVDTTQAYADDDVRLSAGYGTGGLCASGSFPSGHTTTAYQAALTLATLLPELGPELLARASEAGNDRIVLGVHYPLDIVGGRIAGEAAVAARWSDSAYRKGVLEPARRELVAYLEGACGHPLAQCIAAQAPYSDDPYGGDRMPGGTSQIVTDRASAVAVYRERMTYSFPRIGAAGRPATVPRSAADLLRTTFPTLTRAQRSAVLAATAIGSGYPLDGTGTEAGGWQRLDLAAAMSASVVVDAAGHVRVTSTGGAAAVTRAG